MKDSREMDGSQSAGDQDWPDRELYRAVISEAMRIGYRRAIWAWAAETPLALALIVLACFGCARLGWWGVLLLAALLVSSAVFDTKSFRNQYRAYAEMRKKPPAMLREELVDYWSGYLRRPRWIRNTDPAFARRTLTSLLAEAPLAAYGLMLWVPAPIAIAVVAVTTAAMIGAHVLPSRKFDAAVAMIFTPRGPEGLPTPEI